MRTPFGNLPAGDLIGRIAHLPKHVITMGGGRGGEPQKFTVPVAEKDDPNPQKPDGGGRGNEP
ncbi:MAG: hypothetical protein M3320_01395 [Actinomycetota bacterium]|nr:hypothetical protein [Actinomycetota bacterium]MDQ5807307.1 hypothetical protein [Actinomycetota bacterium]